MPRDWEEVVAPRVRVHTIAESMQNSRTLEWVAEQARVDEETAQDVLAEMVDDGVLIECDDRFKVNEYHSLAATIREIGKETEDGILIPWSVIEEYESPQ